MFRILSLFQTLLKIPLLPQPDLDTPFTVFELYRAFRRTKTGRAPGPDNLPMETLRLLPHQTSSSYTLQRMPPLWYCTRSLEAQ